MADYFPLIANPVGNLITELPANNNLNLANSSIINAVSIESVGNVTGTYFIGNGSLLTGIDATSIQNGTSNVRVVSAGGNVAVGVNGTSNVVVTANTGVYVTGLVSASGEVTGSQFNGSAAGLTAIPGANVTGTVANATYAVSAGSATTATSATTAGTVTTAAQPNITSVGTLSSVAVTGNVTGGNVSVTGSVIAPAVILNNGSADGGGVLFKAAGFNDWEIDNSSGVLRFFQPGLTYMQLTTGGLSVTGNISGGNVNSTFFGSGAGLSSLTGANVTGTVANATYAVSAGTVTTAAQTNITSVGTLTGLTVSGAITVNSGSAATAIVNGATTGVGNIGSSTVGFNTVFAKATSAQYADLAEKYTADADYDPGTVLIFGGDQEVTMSTADAQREVVGVVSTNPAYVMNSALEHEFVATVALTGRTPVKVIGPVRKGDFVVSAANGHARASADPKLGTVIGKAIENFDGATGVIEVLINNH